MEFVAIDVETANADLTSICQVGLAHYSAGALVREVKSYVDPEDEFDPFNVSIHGIDEPMVAGAPNLGTFAGRLHEMLDGRIAVSHTPFDRVAVRCGLAKYGVREPSCKWLDTARVARRTWEDVRHRGYGLVNLCVRIGYMFQHHDALEDAKAAAQVLLSAVKDSGIGVTDWVDRSLKPMSRVNGDKPKVQREGNPDGPLQGEVAVFTGALSMTRQEAADLAAQLGCDVDAGVTKRTTLLIVGDQDARRLKGEEKSAKHRKAEDLIARGLAIRILRETDLRRLLEV